MNDERDADVQAVRDALGQAWYRVPPEHDAPLLLAAKNALDRLAARLRDLEDKRGEAEADAGGRRSASSSSAAAKHSSTRDYLERTIETVRNHRGADNCWPQWANIFADEIEECWRDAESAGGTTTTAHYGRVQSFPPYVGGDDDSIDEWQAVCDCGFKGRKWSHVSGAHMDVIGHLNGVLLGTTTTENQSSPTLESDSNPGGREVALLRARLHAAERELVLTAQGWRDCMTDRERFQTRTEAAEGRLVSTTEALRRLAHLDRTDYCGVIHGNMPRGWTCLDQLADAKKPSTRYTDEYRARILAGERLCEVCIARAALAAVGDSA